MAVLGVSDYDYGHCGEFAVCVEYAPEFVLEVTATDWLSCDQNYSAETLFPNGKADNPRDRWVAYSPPKSPTQEGCQWRANLGDQRIDSDWRYEETQAAAFFPATMIALDMREFMALAPPTSAGVDISHENYRAHFRYPQVGPNCYEEATPPATRTPSNACYRREDPPGNASGYIYLNVGYADKWDVVTHEYGHDAHDALGIGWDENDTTQFPEGVAELIHGVKETLINNSCVPNPDPYKYYRGGCYGRPTGLYACPNDPWMERLPTPGYEGATDRYAGWLYDVWDESPFGDDMPEARATCPTICPAPPPDTDDLSIPLGELWDTFGVQYPVPPPNATADLDAPFATPAVSWVEQWMANHPGDPNWARCGPMWRQLLTVSIHHQVYNNCQSFPAPPAAP